MDVNGEQFLSQHLGSEAGFSTIQTLSEVDPGSYLENSVASGSVPFDQLIANYREDKEEEKSQRAEGDTII